MNKFIILLTGFLFLLAGNAIAADTYVVYKPGTSPCTTANPDDSAHYYNTIQTALDAVVEGDGHTAIVCPGLYVENVKLGWAIMRPRNHFTLRSHTQNPDDPFNEEENAIVQAADPLSSTFYLAAQGAANATISGFTITGATGTDAGIDYFQMDSNGNNMNDYEEFQYPGGNVCKDSFNNAAWRSFEDPPQPCAGIRLYCIENDFNDRGHFSNNIITGNTVGVIVKDTAPNWWFNVNIENNEIYDNDIGIQLIYGSYSYVLNNHIHDNQTYGVYLRDTWNNEISGNIIESNPVGVRIRSVYFDRACPPDWGCGPPLPRASGHSMYHNSFINNTTQALDDNPWLNNWYEPDLQEGNYWSDNPDASIAPFPELNYDNYPLAYSGTIYDKNQDWIIGDFELLDAIDDWAAGNLGNFELLDLIDLWAAGCYHWDDAAQINKPGCTGDTCPIDTPVRTEGISTYQNRNVPRMYYSTLQSGYDAAGDGDTIQIQDRNLTGDLNINMDKSVSLKGGYDCDYATNTGTTVLKGVLAVTTGSLRISGGSFTIKK